MRRWILGLLVMSFVLCGCSAGGEKKYQCTYWGAFDTVTTISGFAASQEELDTIAQPIYDQLVWYHQLFDIYNDYPGLNNLKTVNDQAGIAPVQVDGQILELLQDCKAYYEVTDGLVNAAMGGVLRLWHDARTAAKADPQQAALPDAQALEEAARHTNWDAVILDVENSTVYLADPSMSLDVGAIAKGWATQKVAEGAPAGLLLSVGSNICATGPKPDGSGWKIGVQDPDDPAGYLATVSLQQGAAVTSGDYQRYYTVDGQDYHHIIHPATGYPATYWRSVTILCSDSGLADMLSTALFLLPLEEGRALLARFDAEAMWVDAVGNICKTEGFGN